MSIYAAVCHIVKTLHIVRASITMRYLLKYTFIMFIKLQHYGRRKSIQGVQKFRSHSWWPEERDPVVIYRVFKPNINLAGDCNRANSITKY